MGKPIGIWENHWKTMGKTIGTWEKHWKTMGKPWENGGLPSFKRIACFG